MLLIIGSWKSLAFRGIAAVVFGILASVWPAITVLALVFLFGIYALTDGISILMAVFRKSPQVAGRKGPLTLHGAISILAGITALVWPGISALALILVIAAWAALIGALQIAAAIKLRKEISNEWRLGLAGVLAIGFGVLLVISPGAGALALTWIIGVYAILAGALLLGLALRVRQFTTGSA